MSRVPCSVSSNGMGPQVAPPALPFASYWEHFWGPASYLLCICSISDFQPLITRYMMVYATCLTTYYIVPQSTIYIYIYIHTFISFIYIYISCFAAAVNSLYVRRKKHKYISLYIYTSYTSYLNFKRMNLRFLVAHAGCLTVRLTERLVEVDGEVDGPSKCPIT